ncbi:CobW/HypB/UreG, nucleotide-binding domain-containing protein [Kalaharituber pfeilii]|nr:CobW/HypB/UreG, nucleotide-binding domain-containing protein [Kalaharituber pfeilii]
MTVLPRPPIPITILTGFLGAGKTTLLLNLLPQLPPPPSTRLCLLKNEFGSVAVDSKLLSTTSSSNGDMNNGAGSGNPVAGVQELLNGCICCNLVGQLEEALNFLVANYAPTRIVIETSGSAFPATLAMEVNRLSTLETSSSSGVPSPKYFLDGIILVIDVANFSGYKDTSYTAKLQAGYTDLVVLNKWEDVPGGERRIEDVVDLVREVCVDVPVVRSRGGWVDKEVLLGIDREARKLPEAAAASECKEAGCGNNGHCHGVKGHVDEVDVLSVWLATNNGTGGAGLDYDKLLKLLTAAPKDEIYRIKALFRSKKTPPPPPLPGRAAVQKQTPGKMDGGADLGGWFILNWAFGRWTVTRVEGEAEEEGVVCDMTVVLAQGEGRRWKGKIEKGGWVVVEEGNGVGESRLRVETVV